MATSPMPRAAERMSYLLLLAVFFGQLVPFLVSARYRLVDGDEGFYLMASRLVFQGKVPYRDFFFTQTPLMPYLYGLWLEVAGHSWAAGRALAAIIAAVAGVVLFRYVCLETRKRATGIIAVLLFVSSTQVFGWFPIVKAYSLSALLLLLALLLIRTQTSGIGAVMSGMCMGLAVDTRLYLAGVLPLLILWIYRDARREERLSAIAYFLAGFGLMALPNVYIFALDPAAYLFDTWRFHSIRSEGGFIGNYPQKLLAIAQLCFGGGPGNGFQMTLLIVCIAWVAARGRVAGTASRRPFQLAAMLAFLSLLPTPSYVQYFSLCVPFLIITVVCDWSKVLQDMKPPRRSKRFATAGVLTLAVLYAGASAGDLARFTGTGDGLNGIRDRSLARNWQPDAVRAVSRAIDDLAAPGESVMSLWPGYIFESRAIPFPGLENNTGRERVDALKHGEADRFHILSEKRVVHEIERRSSRIVVIGNQESMFVDAAPYREMLSRSGYAVVRTIGDTSIWIAPR